MVLKRVNRYPLRWLVLFITLGSMLAAPSGTDTAHAQPGIDREVAFVEFWSDYKSIFLFHPYLIKEVFLEIITLKGNRRTALRHINSEILSCKNGSATFSECRLDQLLLERKKSGSPWSITTPVKITSVTGHPIKEDEDRHVVTIKWQPMIITPPVIAVETFYEYLGAADNSRYYSRKRGVNQIQISPLFEDRVTVVTSRAKAENLIQLYSPPPTDLRDTFTFQIESSSTKTNGSTANFELFLKAISVKINHQIFQTTKELLQ